MARVLALLLLAGFASATSMTRVIGGSETTIEYYPSLVQVEFKVGIVWGQACAGSILTPRYFLSAASCFSGLFFSPRNRRIRAGSSYRNAGGITSDVAIVINHPSYDTSTYNNDISVVQLETALTYSDSIQQGAVIAQGVFLPEGLSVVSAGWGVSSIDGYASDTLLEANLLSISNEDCNKQYSSESVSKSITGTMICASSINGDQRACSGDEGGPLYYLDIIFGVASRSRNCTVTSLPSVYTSVSQFTNWIIETAV